MAVAAEKIEHVILPHAELVLTPDERSAILELAYVTIAWDGALDVTELDAFRVMASRLRDVVGDPVIGPSSRRPKPVAENHALTDEELKSLLSEFAAGLQRKAADDRLLALATRLRRPEARAFAYEIAVALSLIDGDGGDAEFELELQLTDALGLDSAEAEALAKKTRDAMLA